MLEWIKLTNAFLWEDDFRFRLFIIPKRQNEQNFFPAPEWGWVVVGRRLRVSMLTGFELRLHSSWTAAKDLPCSLQSVSIFRQLTTSEILSSSLKSPSKIKISRYWKILEGAPPLPIGRSQMYVSSTEERFNNSIRFVFHWLRLMSQFDGQKLVCQSLGCCYCYLFCYDATPVRSIVSIFWP